MTFLCITLKKKMLRYKFGSVYIRKFRESVDEDEIWCRPIRVSYIITNVIHDGIDEMPSKF